MPQLICRIAVALLVVLPAGTYAASEEPKCPPDPDLVLAQSHHVFLIDESAFRPREYVDGLKMAAERVMVRGRSVAVFRFAGQPVVPTLVLRLVAPAPTDDDALNSWKTPKVREFMEQCAGKRLREQKEQLVAVIEQTASRRVDDRHGASPIFSSIRDIAKAYEGKEVAAIVVTDGIEFSPALRLDFYSSSRKNESIDNVLDMAAKQGLVPNLANVRLTMSGIGLQDSSVPGIMQAQQAAWVMKLWTRYAVRTGARVSEISSAVPLDVR